MNKHKIPEEAKTLTKETQLGARSLKDEKGLINTQTNTEYEE